MIAGTPWLVAVVIFCHGHGAIAQARYLVGMDGTLSASMGAKNLIAIHRAVYALQDRALKPKLFDETTKARKSAGILYRLGKTALLDNVIDHLPALVQHEVFGHGARFREFGYKEISYRFSLFPPYGSGTGRCSLPGQTTDVVKPISRAGVQWTSFGRGDIDTDGRPFERTA